MNFQLKILLIKKIFQNSDENIQNFNYLYNHPGQSRPAVNGRAPTNYDGKRQPFTLAVYSNHIRCSAVYYNHRKQ